MHISEEVQMKVIPSHLEKPWGAHSSKWQEAMRDVMRPRSSKPVLEHRISF
jgi:hypothetical protein